MKRVQVKLYATLRKYAPAMCQKSREAFPVELEDGARLSDLLATLCIPDQETKLVFINGERGSLSQRLKEEDEIAIFPPIAGGGKSRGPLSP